MGRSEALLHVFNFLLITFSKMFSGKLFCLLWLSLEELDIEELFQGNEISFVVFMDGRKDLGLCAKGHDYFQLEYLVLGVRLKLFDMLYMHIMPVRYMIC